MPFSSENAVLQSAAVANGNGTVMNTTGCSVVLAQVVGITGATINWEVSADDVPTWVAVASKNLNSGAEATTATADGLYSVPIQGATRLRARISAYAAGTITITAHGIVGGVQAINTTVAAVVGIVDTELPTAAALNGTWAKTTVAPIVGAPLMLSDGTNEVITSYGQATMAVSVPVALASNQSPVPMGATAGSQAVSVTTSGAGYVAGDDVGGIISLLTVNYASGRRVNLRSLVLRDKGASAAALHIYFFKATPAAGTYTDNAALAWGAGDAANLVGSVNVQAGDWLTDATQSFVSFASLNLKMPVAATTLFVLIVSEGTYTITNGNLTMNLEFDQE